MDNIEDFRFHKMYSYKTNETKNTVYASSGIGGVEFTIHWILGLQCYREDFDLADYGKQTGS